jgi:hypothetical protein
MNRAPAATFGDLRALLQEPPSHVTWQLLCALLDQWPEDDPELHSAALPYALQHTARWPEALLDAPRSTSTRLLAGHTTPSIQLAARLDTSALDATGWAALQAAQPARLRAIALGGGDLSPLLAWPQTEQLRGLELGATTRIEQLDALRLPGLERLDMTRSAATPHALAPFYNALPPLGALALRARLDHPLWALLSPHRREAIRELTVQVEGAGELATRRGEPLLGWLHSAAPAMRRLRAMNLTHLHAAPGELVELLPTGLERLALLQSRVPSGDWHSVLAPHRDTLQALHIWSPLEPEATRQLGAAELPQLRALTLTSPRMSQAQASGVLGARWMAGLETLRITGQQLDAGTLARMRAMPALHTLALSDCAIAPDALAALLAHPGLPALRHLELSDLPLAMSDVHALATSPMSQRLQTLALLSCKISEEQLARLQGGTWPALTLLDLRGTELERRWLHAPRRWRVSF